MSYSHEINVNFDCLVVYKFNVPTLSWEHGGNDIIDEEHGKKVDLFVFAFL